MAILKLNGDTSGYVILQAASVAQNNVLTLPNVTDTLLSSNNPVMSNASINGSTLLNATLAGSGTITGTLSGGTLANTTLSSPNILGSWSQQNLNLVGTSALVGNGVYIPAVNTVGFITNTTERMRLTAGGNLLINGTTAPSSGNATVVISGIGTNGGGLQLSGGAAGGVSEQSLNGGGLTWNTYTGAVGAETYAERMRLDSNGNLGVGVSTLSLGGRLTVGKPAVTSFTGSASGVVTVSDTSSTLNSYTALDFTNTNQQLPLARIAMQFTNSGSYLSLGTTNSYGSGVNNRAMTIDPNGNVGIGTSSPSTLLTVNGTATITTLNLTNALTLNGSVSGQITISPPSAAGTNTLTLPAATGTVALTANPTFTGTVTATTITSPAATNLTIQSAGTTAMTIDTSQNVGIGTSSPGYLLDVNGAVRVGAGSTSLVMTAAGDLTINASNAAGQVAFRVAGSEWMRINSSGYVAIGTTSAIYRLGVLGGATQLSGSTSSAAGLRLQTVSGVATLTGINYDNNAFNPIAFYTTGTEAMRIASTGNVGIGSTTPQQTLDVSGNVNVAGTVIMGSSFLRNRIINGAMQIDQRNAGASGTAISVVTVDRWLYGATQASKGTWGQNLNSVTLPSGFSNYLGFQSSSAYTVLAGDQFFFRQAIEGNNFYDFGFGTAAAKTITLSFVVYSSLTGTFSGSFTNYGFTRSYPFTYTISAANTWTTVYVTIPGDTGGTWVGGTNAGAALVWFSLGIGSTYTGPASAWATASYAAATGATSVVGTSGATFYITGVQLEIGSVATPFERKLFDQILIDCQRYYEKSYDVTVVPGTSTSTNAFSLIASSSLVRYPAFFKVTKRIVNGTITFYSTTGASGNIRNNSAASDLAVSTVTGSVNGYASSNGGTTNNEYIGQWTIDAEI